MFILFAVASCTERIDIPTIKDAPQQLVIYGYITTDTVLIRITRSAGYFTTDSPVGVSEAIVTISTDKEEPITLKEKEKHDEKYEQGLYFADPGLYGKEGKTYTLNVHLDASSQQFEASAYLQTIHHIDSIELRWMETPPDFPPLDMVEVCLFAKNYSEDNTYSIFVAINDTVVNSTINDFFLIDDAMLREQEDILGVGCYWLNQNPRREYQNNEILKPGDKVTLNMNAISKEYAAFIRNAQSEISGSNPIFGGPPANVPTNIRRVSPQNGTPALGFFTAFPSRYAHTIVEEDFLINR